MARSELYRVSSYTICVKLPEEPDYDYARDIRGAQAAHLATRARITARERRQYV